MAVLEKTTASDCQLGNILGSLSFAWFINDLLYARHLIKLVKPIEQILRSRNDCIL